MFSKELHYTDIFKKLIQNSVFSFRRERQQNQSNILKAVEPHETKDWFLNFPSYRHTYVYACICERTQYCESPS